MAATYVHRGLNAKGVVTCTKHFAFNDQETNRDGLAVFLSEQAARENELRGFQIPIRDDSLKGLMSAFNRVGPTHVAAHAGLMNGILRGEWGFNGYLITDAVKSAQYFLPRETLMAGNDSMLMGSNNGTVWNFTAESIADDPVVHHRLLHLRGNAVYCYRHPTGRGHCYVFAFESYGVEDKGNFTYDGSTLTITNTNGSVVTTEGDPLTFHYVSAVSDLLTGDFTVSAAELATVGNDAGASSNDGVTITSISM